ncbi:MAG: Ig-like domain-containing protein, partial [Limisphaerales bacterium]
GFAGVPTYPDSAKVGVDGDAIYVTAGHFAKDQSITASFSHAEIFAIDKAPLLSGGSLRVVDLEPVITDSYSEAAPFSIHPAVVHDSGSAMYFVQSLTRRADDKIVVRTWDDVLSGSPATTVAVVGVDPFHRPPNVPQLGSSTLLENIDARLMSAVVRNGSLWTSHAILDPAVDGESVVRWYEFDLASQPGTVLLAQSGNVDPGPGVHTWLPSINVDVDGNMGLCFSVGGAGQYAAIGYTGRLASDPLNTTILPVRIARAGNGAYTQGGWGEYSGLAMDPDGYTFWLFHQYPEKVKRTGTWRTYVGAFEVVPPAPLADPLHCGDLDGIGANTGKNWRATVVATLHDGNESPVQGATVSIQWSTGVPDSGVTDASGRTTFTLSSISKQVSSVTLTINGMTYPGLNYSLPDNHDPDGDSNGTSITVSKP